ncbi:peptide ABC transporter substrate-binding protein [Pseudobdellovibrio exovorus]|uniref:Solute-binding protein family 5 domain-containing protein n=1 Tax=Pseudobdellovibrio exovorus JSS TaxID=1184267 RepID=M4V6U2_9BACT|nr:peptide ABC transporter substrate-binding protein [Pseudobdellovibrio exovorus]AGH95087.1 hypothetical protein A11Q_870 [Pseudobdellovibrio exovorus JSS]
MAYFFTVLFLLSSSFAFAAPSSLTIAIIQEWSHFNPVTSQLASNESLDPFLNRKMIRHQANGSVVADIAVEVPTLKKNKAVWTIKPNAKWGDGQDITCADWHLGWQAGLNPKVSVISRQFYNQISNIEWTPQNPKVCTVTYINSDWSYDRNLPSLLPSHLEKNIYDKSKNESEGYDRNTLYIGSPTNKGLYSGPYTVTEFKLGSHVILDRNKHFFGTQPQIERVVIKYVSDTSALKAHLLSGQINAIGAVGFPPDTALNFAEDFKAARSPHQVRFQNSGIFQGIYFNLDKEPLKDIKVREALSRAVDKERIVSAFFSNHLQAAEGILSPQHPAYKATSSIHSKKRARELLDEAGWKVVTTGNSNGIRQKNGKTLSLQFKTSAGIKVLENIQQSVCSEFKSIGVECIIKNEPPRLLLGQSVPRGDFDLAMYGQPVPIDLSLKNYFSSKEIPTAKNSWAGGNSIRLRSPEVDKLLIQFEKENQLTKRHEITLKLDELFRQNFYLLPLYHRREAVVIPKSLTGMQDSYEGTVFAAPENWQL